MATYVLKFSACLLVFWLVYILILERQKMHRFKRFYLLGSFITALIIPLLTITTYIEPVIQNLETASIQLPIETLVTESTIEEASTIDPITILWFIYGIGVLLFGLRFAVNLIELCRNILKNDKVSKQSFIYVLLKEYRIPHSFFRYIFLNRQKFEQDEIPNEVLLHEQTHAKQLHSLDILLLELLQIVFWFHPLIYILKHHVKLNHEFLADEAVLNNGVDTKIYQNILLQFSSSTQNHQLVSAINFSSFKKRFTVMKTQTSKTKMWLSTMLLLPVIALLFYSFAEREYVKRDISESTENIESNIFLVTIAKSEKGTELKCEVGCKWSHLVLKPSSEPYIINDYGFSEGNTLDTDKFTFSIQPSDNGIELTGLKGTAWIDLAFSLRPNKRQAINQLGMTNTSSSTNKAQKKVKKLSMQATDNTLFIDGKKSSLDTYVEDLNAITSNWTKVDFENTYLDLKTQNCSEKFLKTLNELHKKTDHFLITVLGSKSIENNKDKVVKTTLKNYEAYKKLQDTPPHYIKKSEAVQKQMEALFSDLGGMYFRMSKENKAKVVRPTAPILPYAKITLNGKTYYKKRSELTKEEKATLPPPPPPPSKKSKGGPNANDSQEIYNPSFLEYILEMEQLGASFYLDNKKITSKKAKSIAKNNKGKQTEMLTQKDDSGKYLVKLKSSKPLQQQKATQKQIAEYNKLAKYYNSMIGEGGKMQIKMKDVEKLKYIYGLMSAKQRDNAEPFPNFPKPPPPPPTPEEPKPMAIKVKEVEPPAPPKNLVVKGYKAKEKDKATKSLTKVEKAKKKVKGYSAKQQEQENKVIKVKGVKRSKSELSEVPPPPPPPVPLDFVIVMAKKGANFFYEGKSISSDKAIELLKKDPGLNINKQKKDNGQIVVHISKRPMVIEVKEEPRN